MSGFFHVPGWLYDGFLGTMLRKVRRRVAGYIDGENLYPCLDICCGTGSQGRAIAAPPNSIVGLDRDCEILRFAAYRAPALPFFCGDAAALPFKDGAFKSAVLSFALHHLTPEERAVIIREARRVLAPGGKFVFVEFEPAWDRASRWGARFRDLIERMPGDPHYGNGREFLARGGLRAFIRDNGLEERARHDVRAGAFAVVVADEKSENHRIV